MANSDPPIKIKYKFCPGSGISREFDIRLDNKTLNLIQPRTDICCPEWATLENFKCSICTLDTQKYAYCPIAVNIFEIVDFFKISLSYDEADVIVETDARTYSKHTSLQIAVSSLLGIYMVTSGCPIMEKLRPMVRYHLPFATLEETSYRIISMYLLAQYFLFKNGIPIDMELSKLNRIYDDVIEVNRNICEKLRNLDIEDAILNALVNLDCFACSISLSAYTETLAKIEYVFKVFM